MALAKPLTWSLPPREMVEELLDWAKGGRIMRLREWSEEERHGDYPAAANHLYELAKGFQMKAIQSCLEAWLMAGQEPLGNSVQGISQTTTGDR